MYKRSFTSNRAKGHKFDRAGKKLFQLFRQAIQSSSPKVRTSSQRLVSSNSLKKHVNRDATIRIAGVAGLDGGNSAFVRRCRQAGLQAKIM